MDEIFQRRALARPQPHTQAARRWLEGTNPDAPLWPDPARCLLAIREARAALARRPDDTRAYRLLSVAYRDLMAEEAALQAGLKPTPETARQVRQLRPRAGPLMTRFRQRATAPELRDPDHAATPLPARPPRAARPQRRALSTLFERQLHRPRPRSDRGHARPAEARRRARRLPRPSAEQPGAARRPGHSGPGADGRTERREPGQPNATRQLRAQPGDARARHPGTRGGPADGHRPRSGQAPALRPRLRHRPARKGAGADQRHQHQRPGARLRARRRRACGRAGSTFCSATTSTQRPSGKKTERSMPSPSSDTTGRSMGLAPLGAQRGDGPRGGRSPVRDQHHADHPEQDQRRGVVGDRSGPLPPRRGHARPGGRALH